MKESSKNILILILLVIFVGLSYLLYYSYNYQKKLVETKPTIINKEASKALDFKLNGKDIKIELKDKKNYIEVYFNNKKLTSIDHGLISTDNIFEVVNYEEIDYLVVSIPGSEFKPFILNDEGKIIYEFDAFVFNNTSTKFIDEENNTNLYVEDKKLFFYKSLEEEDKVTYSESEYAKKYLVNIVNGEITSEFVSIEHGTIK